LIDRDRESVRLGRASKGMMTVMEKALGRMRGRHLAAGLTILVALLCLGSVAPASAAEAECPGHDGSPRLCSQAGSIDPLPAVVPLVSPAGTDFGPVAWLPVSPPRCAVTWRHASPASPRAPPFSRF
jgi:hypothetical protein